MISEPRIFFSIVIPTYNREGFIAKTIESVLRQDFGQFEIIVVDDGSTDNTEKTVAAVSDPRIRYYRKVNGERGAARNYGAVKALGEYLNFFDSDDLMYPAHLREAKALVEAHHHPEFLHLAYDHRLEDGTMLDQVNDFNSSIHRSILFSNQLSCNGVFLRKDIALQFPFEENRVLASSEDWELWIRLSCRFSLVYSNEITSSVIHHDQRSLLTIPATKIVARDLLLINNLRKDPAVLQAYGRSFRKFTADRYTFFMLNYAEQNQKKEVLWWAARAFHIYPLILLNRRFLASIKNIII